MICPELDFLYEMLLAKEEKDQAKTDLQYEIKNKVTVTGKYEINDYHHHLLSLPLHSVFT